MSERRGDYVLVPSRESAAIADLTKARTASENARTLIDALEEVADFGEDAFGQAKVDIATAFNLLAPYAAAAQVQTDPPAEDVREPTTVFADSLFHAGLRSPESTLAVIAFTEFLTQFTVSPKKGQDK